jgi:hypothetical protein
MTPQHFRQLAETWGGDPERWPAATRPAARAFAETAEGREILAGAQRLDGLLAAAPEVDAARAGRVGLSVLQQIAAADRARPWYRAWQWRPTTLAPAAGLACSALVGLWLAGALPYAGDSEGLMVVSMVLDSTALSFGELQ